MKDSAMLLSGEDSGLATVWDEICAQQQSEESVSRSAYMETTRALSHGRVEELPHADLTAVWLRTEQGEDWSLDNGSGEAPIPAPDDVAEFLFAELLSRACDHTNPRIRAYLDRRWSD